MTPSVGIHKNVPAETYHAWDAVSNSRLSRLAVTPAHLRAYLDDPPESTDAQRKGTAIHYAILEPGLFSTRYTRATQCEATKKDGERCSNPGTGRYAGHWFCGLKSHAPAGEADGIEVLSPEDYADCVRARASVDAHSKAREALAGGEHRELSLVWDDPETGLLCKARIDHLNEAMGCTVEVKKTRSAAPRKFAADAYRYGYHRQSSWYREAVLAFPGEFFDMTDPHRIVALEDSAPFALNVFTLADGAMEAGRAELRTYLRQYADCLAADSWPMVGRDYSADEVELTLPDWAWDEVSEIAFADAGG